jgi:heme exporter protein A
VINIKDEVTPRLAIEANRLCKSFDEHPALRDIDLKIHFGESLAVFGPNGAGKTTLIKILATIMNPSSGSILVDGISAKDNAEEARRKIGIVSHNTFLYGNLTAYENLDFYRRLYDMPEKRILEVAEMVGMQTRLHDYVSTLSRGMQQRFSIARALLHKPSIILLDEPETGLDQQALAFLWEVLKSGDKEKRTVIIATHNLDRGLEVSDRVLILARGRIVFERLKSELNITELKQAYQIYASEIK